MLNPRTRFWLDVDREVLALYLSGASHRKVASLVGRRMASKLGISTSWRRIQEIGKRLRKEKNNPSGANVLGIDEVCLKRKGEKIYGLLKRDMEGKNELGKVCLAYPERKFPKIKRKDARAKPPSAFNEV